MPTFRFISNFIHHQVIEQQAEKKAKLNTIYKYNITKREA